MSTVTSSHAYGIGVIALIIGMSASVIFYTSFYLPESLLKPSVADDILNPESTFLIEIVPGALTEGNENYVPNKPEITLTRNNHVIWENNDSTAHTVTPDKPHSDSYSGDLTTPVIIKPGDTYAFVFTEPQVVPYHCEPHPWMTGVITVVVDSGH